MSNNRAYHITLYLTRTIVLLLLSLMVNNCQIDDYQPGLNIETLSNSESLTISEAKEIYNNYNKSKLCNVSIIGRFKIPYEINDVIWEKALIYHNDFSNLDVVEIPFKSNRRIRFFSWSNNKTAKRLDSDQKIIVVKDSQESTGAFVMTIIADDNYTNTHKKKNVCEEIHNDGDIRDFSGIIIYTYLSGIIVRVNKYINGILLADCSLYNVKTSDELEDWGDRILSVTGTLSIHVIKESLTTKSNQEDSANVWWEGDTTGILIDSSVCISDTSDPFDPFDPFDDFYNNPGDPGGFDWIIGGGGGVDPDPGGSASGGNGNGNNHNDNSNECLFGSTSLTIDNNSLTLIYDDDFSDSQKEEFNSSIQTLMSMSQFREILAKIFSIQNYSSRIEVSIKGPSYFPDYKSGAMTPYVISDSRTGHFLRYRIKIHLSIQGNPFGLLEEFFHALQYLYTSTSRIENKGDIEFEAKAFLAKMFEEYPSIPRSRDIESNLDYFSQILTYVEEPTENNRITAMAAMVSLGYFGDAFTMSHEGEYLNTQLDSILTTYHLFF